MGREAAMSDRCILVVDDDPLMRDFLCEALKRKGYSEEGVEDGRTALDKIRRKRYDLIITDLKMPNMDGMKVLEGAKRIAPDIDVVVITAYGTIPNAVKAMKKGAYDYITKPVSVDQIELVVEKALERQRLICENRYLRSELEKRQSFDKMLGTSAEMRKVFDIIEMAAPTKATILIQGESGTGKELVANAIHRCSLVREGPFIKVNCGALPEGLVESELFGHEKGAFTGAIRRSKGRFELANGGTILLDEISEISPPVQVKLLRVLQDGEFERVGGEETLRVDVRVVATTNRDLNEELEKGRFRKDLFYRINVVPINLPPLCRRKVDIAPLAKHFLMKYSQDNGKHIQGVSKEALELLMAYEWPGNVRELENSVERAVIMAQEEFLLPEHFPLGKGKPGSSEELGEMAVGVSLAELEKRLILKTLERENGNRTRTAQILGISIRTIRNKLREYREEV